MIFADSLIVTAFIQSTLPHKEIALQLNLSTKTLEAHVSAVLRKLQLSNPHELSRWAGKRRLVN